jgi:hypothetical protein
MEKKNKKLQLNKETIRNLSDESLEQVAGGKPKVVTAIAVTCQVKTACLSGCPAKSCILC